MIIWIFISLLKALSVVWTSWLSNIPSCKMSRSSDSGCRFRKGSNAISIYEIIIIRKSYSLSIEEGSFHKSFYLDKRRLESYRIYHVGWWQALATTCTISLSRTADVCNNRFWKEEDEYFPGWIPIFWFHLPFSNRCHINFSQ